MGHNQVLPVKQMTSFETRELFEETGRKCKEENEILKQHSSQEMMTVGRRWASHSSLCTLLRLVAEKLKHSHQIATLRASEELFRLATSLNT